MKAYRNIKTGEEAPAHRIGTTKTGKEIYQFVQGYEPLFAHTVDSDGNWVLKTSAISKAASALGRIKTERKANASRENGKKGGRPRKEVA